MKISKIFAFSVREASLETTVFSSSLTNEFLAPLKLRLNQHVNIAGVALTLFETIRAIVLVLCHLWTV